MSTSPPQPVAIPAGPEALFALHGDAMWRLANAVATEADAAARAVGAAFWRAARLVRRQRRSEGLEPVLLASTYRAAIDAGRRSTPDLHAAAAAETLRSGSAPAGTAVAVAALRSLPERWRAAVWLHEVEHLPADELAAVLGVSAAVGAQLTLRGHRGLLVRFEQAAMDPPTDLGCLLRSATPAVPEGLAAYTAAQWARGSAADPTSRLFRAAGPQTERVSRPVGVAAAAVLAVGLIGIGVLGQRGGLIGGGPVRAVGSAAPGLGSPVIPLSSPAPYAPAAFSPAALLPTTAAYALVGQAGAAVTGTGAAGSAAGPAAAAPGATAPAVPSATPPGGGAAPLTGPGTGGPAPAPAGPPPGAPTGGVPGGSPATTLPSPPATLVNLPPVASVTQTTSPGGTSTQVNVGPGTTAPVSVSVGSCTEVNLFGVTIPVACPTSTTTTPRATTTPTTAPNLLGGLGL